MAKIENAEIDAGQWLLMDPKERFNVLLNTKQNIIPIFVDPIIICVHDQKSGRIKYCVQWKFHDWEVRGGLSSMSVLFEMEIPQAQKKLRKKLYDNGTPHWQVNFIGQGLPRYKSGKYEWPDETYVMFSRRGTIDFTKKNTWLVKIKKDRKVKRKPKQYFGPAVEVSARS
ncbi:MAG: hypothetical protein A3G02_00465 [Candidatus Yanofskybacteria bacterium RIFCSPLOWO2_12_FULL_44_13b]|uniref:Uncharacterized protein n=2 Tax=Candidatus Yanofskyibacteriota TaxID=1752733 RepID=A0A1F8GZL3_9BACT|nr:MAG: hypothetical protein UW14_C0004G0010 [Candidatus Yanofskybacteria bacterium GW2011_GWA2_44_10]KKT90318.1 MAG: hypothetical protein UW90_C0003G0042 [Candidatus Yanofskybacteria bacterium GW2011_GWB1_45_11]OGN14526.1 MAG: hypothetical protein A3C01_00360 [Candidatus Yanofskybacteria bacterium RIFCSPHIGHO2_02_FULL_44_36b]OGN18199.1 MAG: hypothetical protein A3F50_02415 [Candidatus Yanofskybacteria bacterium RIFCSPHIGHO2_12_FULL_44_29b]OGN27191.1 MAG: hypothetical protein A3B12_00420 [Candi